MSPERLQKVLASAGIASRRDCEAMIAAGRVTVNGKVVVALGTRVDPERDEVCVDGQPLRMPAKRTYIMLHKPVGVVSTAEDTHGRPTVVDLVDVPARVFPVGRLDLDSEGLILLTDDGELAYALTHPSFEVEKEYRVLLDRALTPEALRSWRNGVLLDGEMTAPAWVELLEAAPEGVWVRIVLREGRKRQIRAVAKLLGYEVLRLIRVREGELELGDLPPRAWRYLTDEEVARLRSHIGKRYPLPERAREQPTAPRGERGERGERPRSSAPRGERGEWGERPRSSAPRGERGEWAERPRSSAPRGERGEWAERPRSSTPRGERGEWAERPRSSAPRGERGEWGERPRSTTPRGERGEWGERPRSTTPRGERRSSDRAGNARDRSSTRSSTSRDNPSSPRQSDRSKRRRERE